MEPRVTKREKKLHLSYDLPHRIHCVRIYPLTAPNGSTVIIYGHDRGLKVFWRGGRRLRQKPQASKTPAAKTNGYPKDVEVIELSDDDDHAPEIPQVKLGQEAEYEEDEDELDPDCPYPAIIHEQEIDLDAAVLQIALPSAPSSGARIPALVEGHAVVAAACADKCIRILRVSLAPLAPEAQEAARQHILSPSIELSTTAVPQELTLKIIPEPEMEQPRTRSRSQGAHVDGQLLIAEISDSMCFWRVLMTSDGSMDLTSITQRTVHPPSRVNRIAFHPSSKSTQLLLADASGAVRIYDPLALEAGERRPGSSDSALSTPIASSEIGRWVMAYQSSFTSSGDGNASSGGAASARRKKILDAKWCLRGKGILALLEDGEWGIWDREGKAQPGKSAEDFALRGFLGAASAVESVEPAKQKRGMPKLAPMTPNTRKAKAENLFSGLPKVAGVAARGGISVASSSARTGQNDESVIMWYGSDVYSIPSLQSFWQRSMSSTGGIGSLYSPGLTHIRVVDTMNENITSAAQSGSKPTTSGLGQMNTQGDLLVSAEHRLIILQSIRQDALARNLLQQATERPTSSDRRMLDVGELDVGGIDRMLDSMANGDGRPRRVGFVH